MEVLKDSWVLKFIKRVGWLVEWFQWQSTCLESMRTHMKKARAHREV
jgi:hypothetical protein